MVTADEIGRRAVRGAPAEQRERLSRAAADIRLVAGEYAVHEGDERALFVVLEGRMETIRLVDGIERVVGAPAGRPRRRGADRARDGVPRRLPRGRADASHARRGPRLPRDRGRGARGRRGARRAGAPRMGGARGLQGIAAEPPPPRAIVIGHRWDSACTQLRRFLDRNQITFRWITPDAPDAAEGVGRSAARRRGLPAIRVIDGKTVVRPRLRRVAELLGLGTEAVAAEYDTVIVGAGPAGLAAAVYGASEGLRTIVVEREAPGGQAGTSSRIENYLGFPIGVSGDELASRALQQARRLGAEILVTRSITRIDAPRRQVHLDGGDVLRARTIILACGVAWRQLCGRRLRPARRQGRLVRCGAQRGVERARRWTSTSSARATRPGRRRCTSPRTPAA